MRQKGGSKIAVGDKVEIGVTGGQFDDEEHPNSGCEIVIIRGE